jgi:aminopeptidase N
VLHALRGDLGDAAFWSGVRLYVRTRAGKGARSADLRAAFESAGHRELGPFFAKWVYVPAPDL